MKTAPACTLLGALIALGACSPGPGVAPQPRPSGSPEIDPRVVRAHAEQFDTDVPLRPAGSQEEFAAATYLTGHLQQAGYVVRLDAVPVEDLVRSTNVVALPEGRVETVVVVPYDTGPDGGGGSSLGLFLELARALEVAAPDHRVQFVALGADLTPVGGGQLGARALVRELEERDLDPGILAPTVCERCPVTASGASAGAFLSAARAARVPAGEGDPPALDRAIFEDGGYAFTAVAGPPRALGAALLELLIGAGS
ncbi:MAG: hypothetical protein ABR575_04540 [Actinomycetota bacterium]